jgi:hypothetical protein
MYGFVLAVILDWALIFGVFKVQYVKVYESLFGKTLDRF